MLKKIFAILVGIIVVGFVGSYIAFSSHLSETEAALNDGSVIAETAAGPIEYNLTGTEGPLILFLHGTPGGYDQSFPPEGARQLSPSRPGYLRTPLDVGRTPQEQANAYAALLDTLNITEKVIVVGASGGGPSAYQFAASFPERTRGLIALEALSHPENNDNQAEMPEFMKNDYLAWLALSTANLQSDENLVKMLIPDPANQARILEDDDKLALMTNLTWSLWPQSIRGEGMDNDMEQFQIMELSLAEIQAPTLAIHGTADVNVAIEQAEYAGKRIANFRLHVIEGADHMMPFTHMEEMGTVIDEFVASLPD